MTNYRPIDSKREEFRKYLERAGVMEALTRALVSLYEEPDKAADGLEYVRSHLNGSHTSTDNEKLKAKLSALTEENQMLRERLSQYEEVPPPVSVYDSSSPKSHVSQPSDNGSVNSAQPKSSSIPRGSQPSE